MDADAGTMWLTREKVRQAELMLVHQAASLGAMETRASNMLALISAGVVALGAAAFREEFRAAAVVAGGCLWLAGVMLLVALRPRFWGAPGQKPADLDAFRAHGEEALLQAIADAAASSAQRNGPRLDALGAAIGRASLLLVLAVPAAILATQVAK
jgi:hypothetical protein